MRIFIFSKSTELYAPKRILEEAKRRRHEAANLFYKDFYVQMGAGGVNVILKGGSIGIPDAVVMRVSGAGLKGPLFVYQRIALIDSFPKSTFIMNRHTYERWPRLNKLEQHYSLVRAKLPVIPSYSFASTEAIDWRRINFPLIAKTSFGSSGQGVFKIENEKELKKIIKEKDITNLIFQKFLPTGVDYRVIVIGGKALPVAMKKTAQKGEFLTNFSRGGKVEEVKLTGQMKKLAEKTAKVFQADYSGIDIMYDEQKNPYILEINRGAQFQGFEESTNINVAEEIIKYLEEENAG